MAGLPRLMPAWSSRSGQLTRQLASLSLRFFTFPAEQALLEVLDLRLRFVQRIL